MARQVGTIRAIYRYPVKSMGGETLPSATLRWPGIDGDRQYAFYRAADTSRFPWLTGREVAELVTYSARYLEPDNPRRSGVRVTVGGHDYGLGDPELRDLLSGAAGVEIRLIQVGRGIFDAMPVSVLSTETLAQLEASCGHAVDPRRFRANILVEGSAQRETEWLGAALAFGDRPGPARLRVNVAIDRCVMITLDPDTAARKPALLRRVVEDFNNEIGVRCATDAPGTLAVGDPVSLAE